MASTRTPGSQCQDRNPVNINDGTLCRAESPKPGPSGWMSRFESTVTSEYDSALRVMDSGYERTKGTLQTQYQNASRYLKADYEGARCLYQAYLLSSELAPEAILHETGYELTSLLKGLLPGLLQMMAIVGATTFIGAGVGAVIGFFFGGVGAAPGAVVGADLGFDLGMAILTWMGLAFLAVSIVKGFGELLVALRNGVEWAWAARELTGRDEEKQVQRAAREMARAAGILVRLILEAIVAYLLKKAAVSSTRGAVSTIRAVGKGGAQAAAEETVASLVGRLRASKLGAGFADWVESNWRDLVENPRLRPKEVPPPEADPVSGNGVGKPKPKPKPQDEPVRSFRRPVASELENKQVNGLKPTRVRPGSNGKVAIVGRGMKYVREYADALREQGYDVEIFDGDTIPDSASVQWDELTEGGTRRLSDAEMLDTEIYKENQLWAQKVVNQDYTVVDLGDPGNLGASPAFSMEQTTIFGGTQ